MIFFKAPSHTHNPKYELLCWTSCVYVGHLVYVVGTFDLHKVLPPRRWVANFRVIGGPVKMSLEWGISPCGVLTEKQLSGGTPLLFLKI